MLYSYGNKVYVKPFDNKIVEVKVQKDKNGNFDVQPTKNIIVDDNIGNKIASISIEEAYKMSNKSNIGEIDESFRSLKK